MNVTSFRRIMLIGLIWLLFLGGCALETPNTPSSDSLILSNTKVIDGDTIKGLYKGEEETIRLLLIDTPETKHPELPVQPFGKEASTYMKQRVEDKDVVLEIGTDERDKYGRILAYVFLDDSMINEELVERGLARVAYIFPPNIKYLEELRAAESTAKAHGQGIWSIEGYVTERGFTIPQNSY